MADARDTTANRLSVGLVGFGEAATAFVAGWAGRAPAALAAYDIKTDDAGPVRNAKLADYRAAGVDGRPAVGGAVAGADVVFSLVTADQAHAAAAAVAGTLDGPTLFLDCNSCSPTTKRDSAALINAAGGRYVDVAIMESVRPKLHRVPVLVSGPHASDALAVMETLGMNATEAPGPVGAASGIKLCRSVVIKGIEALSAEFLLAARTLGVEDAVLTSLEASHPGFGWVARSSGALERMMIHGERRAAEMREAARMVESLGLPGRMSAATADWQKAIADLALGEVPAEPAARVDAVLRALGHAPSPA